MGSRECGAASTQETPAHSRVHLKAGVEKRGTAGKKMIAIAHAMAIAVPKPPADPLEARGCPASMRSGRGFDR